MYTNSHVDADKSVHDGVPKGRGWFEYLFPVINTILGNNETPTVIHGNNNCYIGIYADANPARVEANTAGPGWRHDDTNQSRFRPRSFLNNSASVPN